MADLEENRDTGRNVEPLRRNPPDPTCPLLENSGPPEQLHEIAVLAAESEHRRLNDLMPGTLALQPRRGVKTPLTGVLYRSQRDRRGHYGGRPPV